MLNKCYSLLLDFMMYYIDLHHKCINILTYTNNTINYLKNITKTIKNILIKL